MSRFSVPPAIPSVGEGASSPHLSPTRRRAAGGFSPLAKMLLECSSAMGVASSAATVAVYCAMTGETPAIVVGGATLGTCIAFLGGLVASRVFKRLETYEEGVAATVQKVCDGYEAKLDLADLQIEELWERCVRFSETINGMRQHSPALSADGNVVEFGRK